MDRKTKNRFEQSGKEIPEKLRQAGRWPHSCNKGSTSMSTIINVKENLAIIFIQMSREMVTPRIKH